MNRLSRERSPYLLHAAHQKIEWYPWGEEAFERARNEDKPLFLSTGAVWCHWCHVMAKECFESDEVASLLNERFINIKLDRDERPDIDRIYQRAVAAMGMNGGWPLSVFLTPDKKPFFGGTYFPPEDRHGRPGFPKVIVSVSEFYKTKKDEIQTYTERVLQFLQPEVSGSGELSESIVQDILKKVLSELDPQNGGFGTAPKFPMTGVIEFFINRYALSHDESLGFALNKTLESMAKGGFYDQIGGGFHRYSTDEAWIVPHFEKMADDNAWLLRNYAGAFALFQNDSYRGVAEGIIRFIRDVLTNPDGGFYTSQDADVTPDDEGGYFTWTADEVKNVLSEEEYAVLSLHLLHDNGALHHDQSKRVLFVAMEEQEITEALGKDRKYVQTLIDQGKKKLFAARQRRTSPFVDKTFYTSINGMLITSFLMSFRVFGDAELRDVALKSLQRISDAHLKAPELLHTEGVTGLLEDYIFIIEAFIAAYEVTESRSYLEKADKLMELCIGNFWDNGKGGFFHTSDDLMGIRMKGIEDISHPSANAVGIIQLIKLSFQTSKEVYARHAGQALETFAPLTTKQGVFSGYYFAALDAYYNTLKLTVNTSDKGLKDAARSIVAPYAVIAYGEDDGHVVPCIRERCYAPLDTAEGLREFVKGRGYLEKG
jgi:uncharacterized protein YyaL (SSP411 family)